MGAVFDHKAWRHTGPVYGDLAVGDITQLNVNGAAKDFIVVHQGNPDDSVYDESCEGTWLLMEDVYETREFDSGTNSYQNSSVHQYLNGTFLSLFDAAARSAIGQAKIPYYAAGSYYTGSSGLSAKIFLLSGYEVGFTTSDSQRFPVDGRKLDYFISGDNGAGNAKRMVSNGSWWLRSPYTGSTEEVWYIGIFGDPRVYYGYNSFGIRPCLIMPAKQKIFS